MCLWLAPLDAHIRISFTSTALGWPFRDNRHFGKLVSLCPGCRLTINTFLYKVVEPTPRSLDVPKQASMPRPLSQRSFRPSSFWWWGGVGLEKDHNLAYGKQEALLAAKEDEEGRWSQGTHRATVGAVAAMTKRKEKMRDSLRMMSNMKKRRSRQVLVTILWMRTQWKAWRRSWSATRLRSPMRLKSPMTVTSTSRLRSL